MCDNRAMRIPLPAVYIFTLIAACGDSESVVDGAIHDGASVADSSIPTDTAMSIDTGLIPVDATPSIDSWPSCDTTGDAGVSYNPTIGFAMPTAVTRAYTRVKDAWVDMGEADWSCLGTSDTNMPTTTTVTLSGLVVDLQTDNLVPGATVAAFANGDPTGTPTDSSTTDSTGAYSVTLPVGTEWPAISISATGRVDTQHLSVPLASDQSTQQLEFGSMSTLTFDALPAFVGLTRTPGLGLSYWTMHDCSGHVVANAIATVSAVSGCPAPLPGADTYYFSGGFPSLPVRHSQAAATKDDGRFTVIELPPQVDAFVQVWGYVTGQVVGPDAGYEAPILLAELPFRILGDTAFTSDLRPRRSP